MSRPPPSVGAAQADAAPEAPLPPGPRACWIRWPRNGSPTAGHILHWCRDRDGWYALVLVALPRSAVTPRHDSPAGDATRAPAASPAPPRPP